jgi:hypothetical protein
MNGVGTDITVDLEALARILDTLPVELSTTAAEAHR